MTDVNNNAYALAAAEAKQRQADSISEKNRIKALAAIEAKTRKTVEARFMKRYGHDPHLLAEKLSSPEGEAAYEAEFAKAVAIRRQFQSL